MKIIKQGQKPAEKVYRSTCPTCYTIFEWQQIEGTVIEDLRDGNFYTIECPVCGQTCTHSARWP